MEERPFLGLLADLIKKGKEVRLIHAKELWPNFWEDFDHYPILFTGLERRGSISSMICRISAGCLSEASLQAIYSLALIICFLSFMKKE